MRPMFIVSLMFALNPIWWDVCRSPVEMIGYFAVPADERDEAVQEGMDGAEEGLMWRPVRAEPGYIPPCSALGTERIGQTFEMEKPIVFVSLHTPTWRTTGSSCRVSVYRIEDGKRILIARKRFENVADNSWLSVRFDVPQPLGLYMWEMDRTEGRIGAWAKLGDPNPKGRPLIDGEPREGFDFETRIGLPDGKAIDLSSSNSPGFPLSLIHI